MERFGVTEEQIHERGFTPEFRALMQYEVTFARDLFAKGKPLLDRVDRELAVDLALFTSGGQEILRAIEQQGYDVLRARPEISKLRKAALLLRALAGKLTARSAA
jgi:phytoene/squalene synthetase